MKVLLLSRYGRMGASSRIRSYQYIPELEKHGIKIDVAPLLDDSYLADLYAGRKKRKKNIIHSYFSRTLKVVGSRNYDLLWIEKELFPWLPSWIEQLLTMLSVKYIVDYDDAIFHRYDMLENTLVKRVLGQKIDRIMRGAALVIVGNDYLEKRAFKAGAKRIACVPTVIDLNRYSTNKFVSNEVFTIGWIGSPATVQYLKYAGPVITELCKNNKARLVTIGAGHLTVEGIVAKDHSWSEETESKIIREFDVGIMPLPDQPWTRGKCGYKIIQYMACGKPVVASAVGANIEIIDHGKNGFLVESEKEWLEMITLLSQDKEMRKKMGLNGRKKVETQYCLQVTASKLIHLMRSCI